jgi:hypothetical protein
LSQVFSFEITDLPPPLHFGGTNDGFEQTTFLLRIIQSYLSDITEFAKFYI